MRDDKLIFDVGMYDGRDTRFYLNKGFRVIAVEASPSLVANAKHQFSSELEDGSLVIEQTVVADTVGKIIFYDFPDKPDWSTVDKEWVRRNKKRGQRCNEIELDAVPFSDLLRKHSIPYYLKIDVEGCDTHCMRALHNFQVRPKLLSCELSLVSAKEASKQIDEFIDLGYKELKIVDQARNSQVVLPNPPLEGEYAEGVFDGFTSGPFGNEAPGKWESAKKVRKKVRWLSFLHRAFGAEGKFSSGFPGRVQKALVRRRLSPDIASSWYDIHGRLIDSE